MLGNHLNSNETTFAKLPEFRDYYGRNGSPVKRERSSPSESFTITKTTRRRTLNREPSYVEPAYATRYAPILTFAQSRAYPHHITRDPQHGRAYTKAESRLSPYLRGPL